jgi:hypothetical protein
MQNIYGNTHMCESLVFIEKIIVILREGICQEIELLEFLKGMAHNTWCGARNYKRACPEDNHEEATQLLGQTATCSAVPSFDRQYSTPSAYRNRKRVRSPSETPGASCTNKRKNF